MMNIKTVNTFQCTSLCAVGGKHVACAVTVREVRIMELIIVYNC